jgi:hypothetical protein
MKKRMLFAALVAAAITACGPSIHVTTTAAPTASFSQLHRFRVMTPPARSMGVSSPDDPMLVNSMTNQALHSSVVDAFTSRGYIQDSQAPDFTIAYYASARERLNVEYWDYGYPRRWGPWYRGDVAEVVPYTEGTVIIDVVNPQTKELIWRGRGQATTSNDPREFQKNLREAVAAIVKKFPMATQLAAQ